MDPTVTAQAVDPSFTNPFLQYGMPGVFILALMVVIHQMAKYIINQHKANDELNRAMLERVLTSMNTTAGVVSENSRVLQLLLDRSKSP